MKKIAVFASGSGTNAENIIKYFINNEDIKVAFVLSNNPDAGVILRAERLGVPVFVVTNKDFRESEKVLAILSENEIDFIVLAGFLLKIPSEIIKLFPDNIINIHPALLPKYGGKGMYGHHVHDAVVAAAEKESGITIHYVNENYDEGKIIFQAKFPVSETDTTQDVEKKVHELEQRHFPEVIEKVLHKNKNMKKTVENYYSIFESATNDYHLTDDVDTQINNPHKEKTLEYLLYRKNWIDTVQWHLEDIIRNPDINPVEALQIKRRIDKSNQDRTDIVEFIDNYFLEKYASVSPLPSASINTESPAWAIDRLSILELKIFHVNKEIEREDIDDELRAKCLIKRDVLMEQKKDLIAALDGLFEDIEAGRKYMKVYLQMKLYNDPALNPVLYGKK